MEEHRTMMGAVMKKIQSVKGGPNEAFNSLLTRFEVSNVMFFMELLFVLYAHI